MYKYILFDFDGTLVDTNELIIHCLRQTSKKFLDRDLTTEDINEVLGKPLEEQMRLLSKTLYPEMVLFYREFYSSLQDSMIKEFPYIKEMLIEIKSLGCKTAIVSAKGRNGIEHGLRHLCLKQYIDIIISSHDVEKNKPHPEPAQKALKKLSAYEKDSLLVGDSPYDIICGKNAGVKTVLVNWSIFPKSQLSGLNSDYIISTPLQLIDIIKNND